MKKYKLNVNQVDANYIGKEHWFWLLEPADSKECSDQQTMEHCLEHQPCLGLRWVLIKNSKYLPWNIL